MPIGYRPKQTRELTGKRVANLSDGEYILMFSVYADDYLKEWYAGKVSSNIYGEIRLRIEGRIWRAELGVIKSAISGSYRDYQN